MYVLKMYIYVPLEIAVSLFAVWQHTRTRYSQGAFASIGISIKLLVIFTSALVLRFVFAFTEFAIRCENVLHWVQVLVDQRYYIALF